MKVLPCVLLVVGLLTFATTPGLVPRAAVQDAASRDRFPGDDWMQYADVREAGVSPQALAQARTYWEHRDSSAFLAVVGGAVVASWGDPARRYLIHSVRKSLLSALYGAYRDRIDLNLTLSELGLDDEPPLAAEEKQARVVDLICARSGVYHDAAAESGEMTADRPARGSHPPGTYWYYNNWDFNAAGAAFERLTGERIFDAFGEAIAEPTGMQDYRMSDGYYQYEPDRSVYPSYMFRMSTRDLARVGLLFAREGSWHGRRIIPADWVAESTRAQSAVDVGEYYGSGYGYMWWVEGSEGYTARGTGGHILGVYPDLDLVMVIRADTYHGKSVPTRAAMRLFDMVKQAVERTPVTRPRLVPAPGTGPRPAAPVLPAAQRDRYAGKFTMESGRAVTVSTIGAQLALDFGTGTFALSPVGDARFVAEDSDEGRLGAARPRSGVDLGAARRSTFPTRRRPTSRWPASSPPPDAIRRRSCTSGRR